MKWLLFTTLAALFFGGIFFDMTAAYATDSNDALVSVFCDALIKRSYQTNLTDESTAWANLKTSLEHRAHDPEVRRLDPTAYDECIKTHQVEFEDAEFILGGKELLEHSAKATNVPNRPPPSEKAEIQIPDFGKVSVEEDISSGPQVSNQDVKQRESRYNELWNLFLDRLHGEFAPKRAAANLPTPPRD